MAQLQIYLKIVEMRTFSLNEEFTARVCEDLNGNATYSRVQHDK
jgi:hypothetical protein